MAQDREAEGVRRRARESATAWFAVLEHARSQSDFILAETARRKLELLGIGITYKAVRDRAKGVKDGR